MVVILVLLWGLLHGGGVWCLSGPHSVSVRSGEAAVVRCVYDDGFDNYIKYWCKGESAKHCAVLVRTEATRQISSGKFTIQDSPSSRSFTVTMTNVRGGDSDTYYCGIERNLADNMHRVEVNVRPGVCVMKAPWTDIVEFPTNFRQIEVNQEVKVTCKEKYKEKNITLRCREGSEGFVLSGLTDDDSCVGVCRKAPPWTHTVDFQENVTEIAVNNMVVVSCQQRFLEKKIELWCREKDGKFLFSPEDGNGSCVGETITVLRSLLTSTFGFVVPFAVKLVVLLVILGVKISCVINRRLSIHRKEPNLKRSLQETGDDVQEREPNDYIPPPSRAPGPHHRKQKREEIPLQRMEEEEQEIYENLQQEPYK